MVTTESSSPAGAYVPGVCNINTAEVAHRRNAGYAGVLAFMILAAILLFFTGSRWLRVILFLPAFIAAVGFLQVKYKFCVSYAAHGKQNATDGDTVAQDIIDAAARRLDKQRARKVNTQAALLALAATAIMLLVP